MEGQKPYLLGPLVELASAGPTARFSVLPLLPEDGRRSSFRNVILMNIDDGQSPKSSFTDYYAIMPVHPPVHLFQLTSARNDRFLLKVARTSCYYTSPLIYTTFLTHCHQCCLYCARANF
jgi:hypothetical protein